MNKPSDDVNIVALDLALHAFWMRGVEGCGSLTSAEIEGLVNNTLHFADFCSARGVNPGLLSAAWSYCRMKLTGDVAIPVHATKAEEAERKAKRTSGKLN